MFKKIAKRDGRQVDYNIEKIEKAIAKAMQAAGRKENNLSKKLAKNVEEKLEVNFSEENLPKIEDIQNTVEDVLMEKGYAFVARKYILYRSDRTRERARRQGLMKVYDELTNEEAINSDLKRDNANIDGDTAMGTMLKIGSEGSKEYYKNFVITDEQRKAHEDGDIHIHDFDFYTLTTTCCQIDILKLFKNGFSTGHGFLREPNSIQSYAALACIAIQSNQNDQHGGQSIPNFDFGLAPGVVKTYKKLYRSNLEKGLKLLLPVEKIDKEKIKNIIADIETEKGLFPEMNMKTEYTETERKKLAKLYKDTEKIGQAQMFAINETAVEIDKETAQAMEAVVHNLNTMHSRAGAQTPFSSINYGTDTSPEGRLVTKNILLATDAGLGNGETAIFPIHVFKVKEGVNYNETDPNYDLFKLAMKVSAKRLFPNFGFLDAPFNLQYYKEGHPETEVTYMGCRTRVIGNSYDRENEVAYGRGNLSFTSVNLPRIGIRAKQDTNWFFEELENKMDLALRQLMDRFKIQSHKRVRNFPFLMGQGVWLGSDKLDIDDEVGEVLKHGTLSIGFIGLAETLVALTGKHHGEDQDARILGLEIVSFMRDFCEKKSKETGLNVSLLATPAEGLSGRFVRMDAKKFGTLSGITDREYYTNSFHVPVHYDITASNKIKIEAPYHELTNAGHISYVELDGDPLKNLDAFEAIIRAMKESGVGYGSINHPVDRDPVCGYTGIIDNECPKCGRETNFNEANIERIRRITGYLVGTTDKFNNAKRAEEKDRVKHGVDMKVEHKEEKPVQIEEEPDANALREKMEQVLSEEKVISKTNSNAQEEKNSQGTEQIELF